MLSEQDGLTQKELADRIGVEGPTLIPMIDKMENDGYLRREIDPYDRRSNKIKRSEKTESLWENMIDCALRVKERATKNIPTEKLENFCGVLNAIYGNLIGGGLSSDETSTHFIEELQATKLTARKVLNSNEMEG
jgi:MarR family transcriptional regulator, transcriptional regulator for hemolysin